MTLYTSLQIDGSLVDASSALSCAARSSSIILVVEEAPLLSAFLNEVAASRLVSM
jgi:hypothetical protein